MSAEDPSDELDRLDACSADEARLVSVYVPPDRLVDEVIVFLDDEHEDAAEIDSESARTAVQRALVRLQDELATYDTPPENGLALFCGRYDGTWVEATIETPHAVETFRYDRGESFRTGPLRELQSE